MSFKYEPFTEKQIKLLTWWNSNSPYQNANGIVCDGSVRSGKSLIMSLSFMIWSMQTFENRNFGIAGKSISSLRRNVINQLKDLLYLRGYECFDAKGENYLKVSRNGVSNTYYLFGGKDERSRDYVQGFTAAGFYFDEVTLMPRSFVEQCIARCSVEGAKLWFNCNPEGPYHWFKTDYIDQLDRLHLYRLQFKLYDNPSLSKEVIERYETMFTGVFYKRFVLGEWVMANGIIYDSFDNERNTYDELPIWLSRDGIPIYACDYGTKNPMVFLEGYIDRRGERPIVYIDKEYYWDGRNSVRTKTDSEYVDDFIAFRTVHDSSKLIVDPSASSFITASRRAGIFTTEAKNSVEEGISLVHTMFYMGLIRIHPRCVNTIKEIGTYQWDMKRADNGKEVPLKEHDHCMDALRYLVNTSIRKIEVYRK